MNLYSVNNGEDDIYAADWRLIWAATTEEAEAYYRLRFSDECRERGEGTYTGRVEICKEEWHGYEPLEEGTHEERRIEAMRSVGWRIDGESQCERCELYSMDLPQHRVCDRCCLCPTCRAEEAGERCEACQEDCERCHGEGVVNEDPIQGRTECGDCNGAGVAGNGR